MTYPKIALILATQLLLVAAVLITSFFLLSAIRIPRYEIAASTSSRGPGAFVFRLDRFTGEVNWTSTSGNSWHTAGKPIPGQWEKEWERMHK